jgi:hypothetical protein
MLSAYAPPYELRWKGFQRLLDISARSTGLGFLSNPTLELWPLFQADWPSTCGRVWFHGGKSMWLENECGSAEITGALRTMSLRAFVAKLMSHATGYKGATGQRSFLMR